MHIPYKGGLWVYEYNPWTRSWYVNGQVTSNLPESVRKEHETTGAHHIVVQAAWDTTRCQSVEMVGTSNLLPSDTTALALAMAPRPQPQPMLYGAAPRALPAPAPAQGPTFGQCVVAGAGLTVGGIVALSVLGALSK